MLHASPESVRAQCHAVLAAWGMPEDLAELTAEVMVETDLTGVDSHGISMLMNYEEMRQKGQLRIAGRPRLVKDFAATGLLDGEATLGHPSGVMAMKLAVEKARAFGIGAVGAFNSHHFGAAGYYARLAAEAGMVGLVTSSARGVLLVPTRGAEPVLGTNPWAFACPAAHHAPVLLDMATTTVAANKVKVYHLNDKPIPEGWVVDGEGRPVTDSHAAMGNLFQGRGGGITPLGGTEAGGSHKGYGLALMVQLLGGTLVGGSFSPIRNRTQKPDDPNNIGHLCIAIHPQAFRDPLAFEEEVAAILDVLRTTRPADPAKPVLVPGEPEEASRIERMAGGIPIPDSLDGLIRGICERADAPYLLAPA
ncbi:MAG: Ldh family oxidoreductase [Acetobacteraceae bacterium]|nr:Ldh family oxidoreductase [Acetobacteraceae bacterium]